MEIKAATYNIDGLPDKLDLKDLPWILKPICWVYKLIKGTTEVQINDGTNRKECMTALSKQLDNINADIVALEEDFNYHTEVMSSLSDTYNDSTYTGNIDTKGLFSKTEWWSCFPFPRFKADGLNLLTKKDKITVKSEDIVNWKHSYGYFSHANDKLTHKGFRFNTVSINGVDIDVYTAHFDADFYDPVTCPDISGDLEAREQQFYQLGTYILNRYNNGFRNPIIIMGDFNTTDRQTLQPYIGDLALSEVICSEVNIDRIMYINPEESTHILIPSESHYGEGGLSDHRPYIASFKIEQR